MIENERKFVLDIDEDFFINHFYTQHIIKQGYLSSECRIRSYDESYIFTYKKLVEDELIEIETEITKDDFDKLWTQTKNQLSKTRYTEMSYGDNKWEIDFFKNDGYTYFVMAECEIYNGDIEPNRFPIDIKKHTIHVVERFDERFTSHSLCDIDHAKGLLNEIKRS